jgi:putative CRISPR-associated protein (TIGR02619 family)
MSRDILICTVGTSLFSNIERLDEGDPLKVCERKGNVTGLVKELLKRDPSDRVCGAEINSITSLLKKGKLSERNELYLLISHTDDGWEVGEILKHYYQDSKNPYRFQRVIATRVEGLKDYDIKKFRTEGLKNLVKGIAKTVREKGAERIVINATGGYKAQISFAGLIGQALEIPVMYMFERFEEIIELPPQPVSFNFDLWLSNYENFKKLSTDDLASYEEVKDLVNNERLNTLVEIETIDGKKTVALTAIGQLFHETFLHRFRREKRSFLEDLSPKKEEPKFSKDFYHYPPLGAEEFVKKVWRDKGYVKTIRDFYTNPDLPEKSRFEFDKNRNKVILIYSDGTRTAKFNVEIPSKNETTLKAALVDLNETYFSY